MEDEAIVNNELPAEAQAEVAAVQAEAPAEARPKRVKAERKPREKK